MGGGLEFGEGDATSPTVKKACSACEDPDTKKMSEREVKVALASRPLWELSGDKGRLVRKFVAKNFVAAQEFLARWGRWRRAKGTTPTCTSSPTATCASRCIPRRGRDHRLRL